MPEEISIIEKINQIGSEILKVKNGSESVKQYCLIQKELSQFKENYDGGDSTLSKLRAKYIKMLEKALETLKEDPDVIKYLELCAKLSKITLETSSYMKKLKKENPELHSWIMLNRKFSIYQKLIKEDPDKYLENKKIYDAVKFSIASFREQHKESVDEWEKAYRIKKMITNYCE